LSATSRSGFASFGRSRSPPRAVRTDAPPEVREDLPLAPGFADPGSLDLRAEQDAALRGRLRPAPGLLVPRASGKQHDDLARVDEHLARHDDVLVDPNRDPLERLPYRARIGQHIEEVAAAIRLIATRNRVIAEGAGACAAACALSGKAGTGKIVCIVSGGNIDFDKLCSILTASEPGENSSPAKGGVAAVSADGVVGAATG